MSNDLKGFKLDDEYDTRETGHTGQSREEMNGAQQPTHPDRPKPAQPTTQPTVRPSGSVGPTETQPNMGGGIFDPARWKTSADARLDPKAKIQSASQSKIEVRKPPSDHYVRVHGAPAFNGVFPLYSDSMAKRYDPYLVAPELNLPPQVSVNIKPTRLAVTITDTGRLFLWFVHQTGSEWHDSGDTCILTAMTRWVKVIPDGAE